ncbi:T9SS C-terminal target domain-containing protein, partial [bacterium]
ANLPVSGSFEITRIVDMNMDGFADVVAFGAGMCKIFAGNGGTSWSEIGSFTSPTPGTYRGFAIGDVDNNGFPDIMICAAEGGTSINKVRLFKETSPYTTTTINPTFPRGNERFKNNAIRFIEWVSSTPPSQTTKVKIELSSTGAGGPWTPVADTLPNNGRYQWHVPLGISSANCRLRYKLFTPGTSDTVTALTPNSFSIGILVGIENNNEKFPGCWLSQNYPNPFNPVTNIRYAISKNGYVKLVVFDALGREVETLINEIQSEGIYEVSLDAGRYPSGVYFYKLTADGFSETKRMLLVK